MIENRTASEPDVVLVGAGIMSATLGVFLKELEPALNISMVETLDGAALESSDAWNNAGTGHAANCELNYTPERSDGSIDISKALDVNVEFDLSRQFWSYLVTKGAIADPQSFIHPVPHMSFVHGPDNVAFLKKRFAAMSAHHCYYGMEYTEDKKKLSEWVPLVMEGRAADEQVAATRIITGADVDYGSLTRSLVRYLAGMTGFTAHYAHRVTHISREPGGRWRIDMKNQRGGKTHSTTARFVYLGAGGGALLLLQKSGIPEGRGYGACRSSSRIPDAADFRSAAFGCAAMTPASTSAITPRSMARRPSVLLRCRFPTSTRGSLAASTRSCSDLMRAFPPNSSSMARSWPCSSRSGRPISDRCWRLLATISV